MKKVLSVVLCAGMITTPLLSSSCFADDVTAKVNSQTLATQTAEDKQEQVAEPVVESKDIQEVNPYLKEAMAEIEKIKNVTNRNILLTNFNAASSELTSLEKIVNTITDKAQKRDIENKIDAVKIKVVFLEKLLHETKPSKVFPAINVILGPVLMTCSLYLRTVGVISGFWHVVYSFIGAYAGVSGLRELLAK